MIFELRDVDVRFAGVSALRGATLSIAAGERVALIGANGSGKSTLLRVLNGLVPHASGQVTSTLARHSQAMLFQRHHMLRTSVRNNVALALWLHGMRWRTARTAAVGALARVGLDALAERNARGLSGGQQQRLALARAWALQPALLLLDEPTASLDPGAKREVEALLGELAVGRTLVAVLEQGQQPDGSVRIPAVLVPYTGFDVLQP